MAAPKRTWTPQIVRDRIQAPQLVDRLQKFVFGEIKLSATQVRAAEVLLRKTIPDLSAVTLSEEGGGPLKLQLVSFLGLTPEDIDKHKQESSSAV